MTVADLFSENWKQEKVDEGRIVATKVGAYCGVCLSYCTVRISLDNQGHFEWINSKCQCGVRVIYGNGRHSFVSKDDYNKAKRLYDDFKHRNPKIEFKLGGKS